MNIDANSLYSTAMTMPLPMEEPKPIKEIPPLEMVIDEVVAITLHVDDEVGRIYEVDISYPKELHDHHNDYPLVPENIAPAPEDYSEYIKKLRDKLNRKIESTHVKLTPNVMNKSKYMVYGMNLQLYLILGMKLTKIHQTYEFKQSRWMAPCINFNIELRKNATNKLDIAIPKRLNNSVYGKTMENIRKQVQVELVNKDNTKKIAKLIASPGFESRTEFEGG